MGRKAIGIDIGGSSVKSAIVDLDIGALASERYSVNSPAMGAVDEMLDAVASAIPRQSSGLKVGITFPGVVQSGIVRTAANVAKAWIGHALADTATARLRAPVVALNDADAAGLAEVTFGAGRNIAGTVLVLTLGTGIGSALFIDGRLVPNTEFGHLEVAGREAEARASGRARKEQNLTWDLWLKELSLVLQTLHALLWPDLIVLCGGITEDNPTLAQQLSAPCPVTLGALRADAGIVGAALATTMSSGVWLHSRST
jgi:polyphosphate glucokinase